MENRVPLFMSFFVLLLWHSLCFSQLSGFKLDQTQSSISKKSKEKVHKEVSASAYICPEGLASVNHQYNLASEMYR